MQTDILDVNEIFKDLAVLIQEQGETIGKQKNELLSVRRGGAGKWQTYLVLVTLPSLSCVLVR